MLGRRQLRLYEIVLDVRLFAVSAYVNQRETGSFSIGLDGYDVLVLFRADFEFDITAVRAFARQFMGMMVRLLDIGVHVKMGGVALKHLAILLQFVLVVGNQF